MAGGGWASSRRSSAADLSAFRRIGRPPRRGRACTARARAARPSVSDDDYLLELRRRLRRGPGADDADAARGGRGGHGRRRGGSTRGAAAGGSAAAAHTPRRRAGGSWRAGAGRPMGPAAALGRGRVGAGSAPPQRAVRRAWEAVEAPGCSGPRTGPGYVTFVSASAGQPCRLVSEVLERVWACRGFVQDQDPTVGPSE